MTYVDAFLLPISEKKIGQYKTIASKAGAIWMEHGALSYKECIIDDAAPEGVLPFSKGADTKDDEIPAVAFITYRSRAHRDEVNAKVMADPRLSEICKPEEMPFDCKRMYFGGFETLVDL